MPQERYLILLRAAYDLLTVADRTHYVQETNSIVTRYDEANCDGGIDPETDPIPVPEEEE